MGTAQANALDVELAEAIAETYADPLAFVYLAFHWGEGDLDGQEGPDKWQTDVLEAIGRGVMSPAEGLRFAVSSGHKIGKTALIAWIVWWAMSTRPNLTGVVTANTRSQLDSKTWREVALWHKRLINKHWFKWTASKVYHVDAPETWFVAAIPWSSENPEAMAGMQASIVTEGLILFDEASSIDDIIWETVEGAQGVIWVAFGNPTRNTGRFRECFGRYAHRWHGWKIDSRTAKMADQKQIADWLEDRGEDSDFFRVRCRGEFPRAGFNQFIASDLILEAKSREPQGYGPKLLALDVARFGEDENVVCRRVGDDAKIVARWSGVDTMTTAETFADLIDQMNPDACFVDGVGVGGGVVDRLRQMGYAVVDVNVGRQAKDQKQYFNKRAEVWGLARDWLKAGGCLRSDDKLLIEDLESIEYGFDNFGRIQIEKKEEMKLRGLRSPNDGDALCLTFDRPIAPAAKGRGTLGPRGFTADADYDETDADSWS